MLKFKRKVLLLVLLLFSLMACQTYQTYTAEDVNLPKEYQLPDSLSVNLDTILIPRKELFKDTVLVKLIDKAFVNNFDVRSIQKEIAIKIGRASCRERVKI